MISVIILKHDKLLNNRNFKTKKNCLRLYFEKYYIIANIHMMTY